MALVPQSTVSRSALLTATMAFTAIVSAWPLTIIAQDQSSVPLNHQHASKPADENKELIGLIQELQAKTARLEVVLKQRHPDNSSDTTDMRNMPMGSDGKKMNQGMMGGNKMDMIDSGGMGMREGADDDEMTEMMKTMRMMMQMKMQMKMMQMQNKNMMDGMGMGSGMSGMQGEDMGAMPGKDMGMMGMEMMGGMKKGMNGMQTPSALPGFPGASHIYHIGATGFFLDHPEHIQLTGEQRAALSGIKEKAMLDQATTQRKIDEAEQELWTLTASDQPEVKNIDAKVREIVKLRGDQRIAFIRAVGDAANVLTDEQRQMLVGMLPPNHATSTDHQH